MRRALIPAFVFAAVGVGAVLFMGAAPAEGQGLVTTADRLPTDRLFTFLPGAVWEDSRNRDQLTVVCRDPTPGQWTRGESSVLNVDLKVMLGGPADQRAPWIFTRHGRGGETKTCDLRKGYDTITWEMPGPVDWNHWPNAVIVARAYPGKNPGFHGGPTGAVVWGPAKEFPGIDRPTSVDLALDFDEIGR